MCSKISKRFLVGITIAVLLAGCDEGYGDQVKKLEDFVSKKSIGGSSDYWLVKGSFGIEDRVAFVFGYMDDGGGCREIAELLNLRYPEASYSCHPANLAGK